LNAVGITNLTIRGYGATVRMQKEDYIVGKVLKDLGWNRWYGQYEKAEWRMALAIRGCTKVKVAGLTLRDSGGDGIYVAGGGKRGFSKDIHLKDVVARTTTARASASSAWTVACRGQRVQQHLGHAALVGRGPRTRFSARVDEGYRVPQLHVQGQLRRRIEVFLANLRSNPPPVSILFERCNISSKRGPGIRVTRVADDGPEGLIEFRNCNVERTEAYGIKVRDTSADRAKVRSSSAWCATRRVTNNSRICGHRWRWKASQSDRRSASAAWSSSIAPWRTSALGPRLSSRPRPAYST